MRTPTHVSQTGGCLNTLLQIRAWADSSDLAIRTVSTRKKSMQKLLVGVKSNQNKVHRRGCPILLPARCYIEDDPWIFCKHYESRVLLLQQASCAADSPMITANMRTASSIASVTSWPCSNSRTCRARRSGPSTFRHDVASIINYTCRPSRVPYQARSCYTVCARNPRYDDDYVDIDDEDRWSNRVRACAKTDMLYCTCTVCLHHRACCRLEGMLG